MNTDKKRIVHDNFPNDTMNTLPPPVIRVHYDTAENKPCAETWAARLQCPLYDATSPHQHTWILCCTQQGLCLKSEGPNAKTTHALSLHLNFNTPQMHYRLAHLTQHHEPLLKAFGLKKYRTKPRIVDATAGCGQDSFILAASGCTVTAIERHPLLHALLEDALTRASTVPTLAPIVQRISLHLGDTGHLLSTLSHPIDILYLDPMFPERRKRTQVRQALQLLRVLVGQDDDADALLPLGKKYAQKIIVKRQRHDPFLNNQTPTAQWLGKRNRFDLYTLRPSILGLRCNPRSPSSFTRM